MIIIKKVRNLKFGIKFCLLFFVVCVAQVFILNTLTMFKTIDVMTSLISQQSEEKSASDVYAILSKLELELGALSLKDNELVGEHGEKLSEQRGLFNEITNQVGTYVTIFEKGRAGI